MPSRRANPNAVKIHRSYSISELAQRLDVHKNTIANWQRQGLTPIDAKRPVLFQGAVVREFLAKRNASRKRPCPAGTIYCFRCREPRRPALGMVEYVAHSSETGNLSAMCATCETLMHRRARRSALAAVMPGFDIQISQASPRLNGRPYPSVDCDGKGRGGR